jgi:hypothetical protein
VTRSPGKSPQGAATPRRPIGAWGHVADSAMMSLATDTFCQACGEDHLDLSVSGRGHEVERCKVCLRWEHITVDGQMGNWPGADRCFECWFKMPLCKRIAWIRWSMTEYVGPTPDELEAKQLPLKVVTQGKPPQGEP